MNPLGPILSIIESGIDKLFPDKTEALKAKARLAEMAASGELEHLRHRANIITTEASGSWLQRSWRPLMMVWLAALLGMYWFGYAPDYLVNNPDLVDELFQLLKIGIGGYIAGRSVEKAAKEWKS